MIPPPVAALLSLASSLLVGAVLLIVPWTQLWDSNQLIQPYSWLKPLVLSPVTRGAVMGLGVLNLLVAFGDLYDWWCGRELH